ncbi:hypothetical protein ACP275_01G065700 [Erythranthe tilingii]
MTWWFVTELVNLTDKIIGFEEIWDDGESRRNRRPMALKDLAPNKTKKLVHDIGTYAGTNDEYNIRLLINGKPMGKKLRAYYFVDCMRLVFKYDHKDDALLVQCVPEKFTNYTDILFRLKGLGCVLRRTKRWDKRPLIDVELHEGWPYLPFIVMVFSHGF